MPKTQSLVGENSINRSNWKVFTWLRPSEFMNGVTTWKKPNYLYPAPSITVATDGSVCSSFVQEFPYYAFYKVAILTPKKDKKIPIDAFYYIAYLLNRERWRYVYARKFGKGRISKTKIIAFPYSALMDYKTRDILKNYFFA